MRKEISMAKTRGSRRTMKLSDCTPPRRILVIRGGGLGDFILILPVLAALQQKWPGAKVELLSNLEMGELAQGSGYVEAVHSIHHAEIATLFTEQPSRLLSRFLKDFDLVINFLPDSSGLLERNLRASVPQSLSISPPNENSGHAASQFLATLEALQIRSQDFVPRLETSTAARAIAERVLPSLFSDPESFPIAVHPGSGSPLKNWSSRGYANLIVWIKEELRQEPVVITGEADAETKKQLRGQLGKTAITELSNQSLHVLASILQCCNLLVGNDSGVSHLTAALGRPVLAFFGPTRPQIWRPLGEKVQILRFEQASTERVRREVLRLLAFGPP
jgi:ADP-heptose:LPS heptosyltransferase